MILDFTGGTLQTHGQLVLHGPNGPQMSQKPPDIRYSDPQGGLLISTALLPLYTSRFTYKDMNGARTYIPK